MGFFLGLGENWVFWGIGKNISFGGFLGGELRVDFWGLMRSRLVEETLLWEFFGFFWVVLGVFLGFLGVFWGVFWGVFGGFFLGILDGFFGFFLGLLGDRLAEVADSFWS